MYYHPFIVITIITIKCNSAVITLCYSGTDTSVVLKTLTCGPARAENVKFDPKIFIFGAESLFLFVFVNSADHHHNIWGYNFPVFPEIEV